jgi:hypothetical protein
MPDWTPNDLQIQFNRATNKGWILFFKDVAAGHSFAPEFLLAIASRETNMQNIKGDPQSGVYHGFGIMQVDIGTDPAFCASWTPDKVQPSIERGTEILAAKRDRLAAKGITDLKAIAAAYNTGEGNVIHSIQNHLDPDTTTTHHNYGADVLARMAVFAGLLSGS